MAIKFGPEERAEWERLARDGISILNISLLSGCARTTIYDHLTKRGFDTSRKLVDKSAAIDTAIRMHGEGVPLKVIANHLGFASRGSLWSLLDRAGVRLYRRGPPSKKKKKQQEQPKLRFTPTPEELAIRRQTMRVVDLGNKLKRLRLEQDGRAA